MTKFEHTFTNHPIESEYPKLVRDRIPEIIMEEDGRKVQVEVLDDAGFEERLRQKAVEEAVELSEAENDMHLLEEIADLRELLDELQRLKGFSDEEVKTVQDEKRQKRGGFGKRLLMLNDDKQ